MGSAITNACIDGIEMKAGTVTLNTPSLGTTVGPTTINFQQSYTVAPLVFILPGNTNPDPGSVRVTNITTTSFDVGVVETDMEDGETIAESFSYFAIEPGNYTVSGQQIQAGTLTTAAYQSAIFTGDSYANITFSPAFGSGITPIVIHEIQGFVNDPSFNFNGSSLTSPWLETTGLQATANNTTYQVSLERAETSAGGATIASSETIAYLAIAPGAGSFATGGPTINFNAFLTPTTITGNCVANNHSVVAPVSPIAIASQSARNGGDGGWMRQCAIDNTTLTMQVEEDQANDSEQGHTTESADVLVFSEAFSVDLSGSGGPRMEVASATTDPQEVLTASLAFTSVAFPNAFSQTPLIFTLPTDEGISKPASLRIKNRTVNGFDIAQVIPQGETGVADSMTIDYLAITPKDHLLPDGTTLLEAGEFNTAAYQGNQVSGTSYATLLFNNTFSNPPALLLEVQTINSEPLINPESPSTPWLEVTVQSNTISVSQASVALERAQTSSGTVTTETLGYLALESNQSINFAAAQNKTITMKSLFTPINIQGVDNGPGCFNNTYPGGGFSTTPLAIANHASRFGGDGGWMRRCNNTLTTLGLVVDEDRNTDSERAHGSTEQASFIAFSEAFEWCPPKMQVTKSSAVERDPVNTLVNAKSIPGALVRYTLNLENQSAPSLTSGSVTIVDEIPSNTSLFVESSVTYPSAPFVFTDGVVSSGLSFTYGGYDDPGDDVDFSMDGGTLYNYEPVPDGDGMDSAITHVRFTPQGSFSGMANLTDVPAFSIDFGLRVD